MPEHESSHQLRAVDVTGEGGVITARIVGSAIDAHRAAALMDSVTDAIDRTDPLRYVVVDFGEVDFINSSGVAACLELAGNARDRGAVAIAYRPTPNVVGIFRMVKADRLYTFVHTPDELAKVLDG